MATQPLHFVAKTDQGLLRKINEDDYGFFETEEQISLGGRLFIVADGVGGAEFGEVASQITVQAIANTYYHELERNPEMPIEEALLKAIAQANTQVYEEAAQRQVAGKMGSTVVAGVIHEQQLLVAWVGDSRAYLANPREERLHQLTTDHTTAEEYRRLGQPLPRHAEPDALSRGIGVTQEIEPEYVQGDLEADDIVLLCSDGLYNYYNSPELRQMLLHPRPLEAMAHDLVETAKTRGGADNITLIALAVGKQNWREKAEPKPPPKQQLSPKPATVLPDTMPALRIPERLASLSPALLALGFAGVLIAGVALGAFLGRSSTTPTEAPTFFILPTVTPTPLPEPIAPLLEPTAPPPEQAALSPAPTTPTLDLSSRFASFEPPSTGGLTLPSFPAPADIPSNISPPCGGQTRPGLCAAWEVGRQLVSRTPARISQAAGARSNSQEYPAGEIFTISAEPNASACYIITETCWWYVQAQNGVTGWMEETVFGTGSSASPEQVTTPETTSENEEVSQSAPVDQE